MKGYEEFLVPEEVWVTVCQTEMSEGHHGYTRFPLILLLLLLCREGKMKQNSESTLSRQGCY